ncbi:MAG: HAD family phosphatase [Lachnospiraceae bacterium]|nr:HAD family phosphatase [Lachnospiraceae bacterium]
MRKYDAVIFDMDGIIFDSERATLACWISLEKKYGICDMEKNFLACIGTTKDRTREIMLEAYGDEFPYDLYAKEASKMFHDKYDGGRLPMKKGVTNILDYLKKNHKKIALASSTRLKTVIEQLREAHILTYFDEVIAGDMVAKSKPEPDIFLLACKKIGVDPDNAYAVEDSYNGIKAAYAGGLKAVMVPDLLPADDEMIKLAEIVVNDLDCVVDYLSKFK